VASLGDGTISSTCARGVWSSVVDFALLGDDGVEFGRCRIEALERYLSEDETALLGQSVGTVMGAIARYCTEVLNVTLG
jgi:hypothetical protein